MASGGLIRSLLELELLEDNLFRGSSAHEGWQRVYGGHVLAQALMAAIRTVDAERVIHSLHGYFLLAGDPKRSIVYEVERVRDGKSFATRTVKAIQHGRVMFVMTCSFHKSEDGLSHQAAMPDVPAPDELMSARDLVLQRLDKLPENMRKFWQREQPMDMRPVDLSRYFSREPRAPEQAIWLKSNSEFGDDPAVHKCVLAYASDFTLLDTALIAHGKLLFDRDIQLASLDHAIWFHRPFRADEWLLYVQESGNSEAARGFCQGRMYSQDGTLVASTAQEGLMRLRQTDYVLK